MHRVIAAAAVTLALLSIASYAADRRGRRPEERFLSTFDVAARRPAEAATLEVVPKADLAANVIADIALNDALGTYRLADASPADRARWLRAVELIDDELLAARDIALDAAAARPGWGIHWSMLGKLVYTRQRRHPLSTNAGDVVLWSEPLRLALSAAPGDDSTASAAATACLETWPDLTEPMRADAQALFGRALVDPDFTSFAFPMIVQAIGPDRAMLLLPKEPRALRMAFDTLAAGNDVAGAMSVYGLWEAAEWQARTTGLLAVEERARLHDVEKLRDMAIDWLGQHPPLDFDTPAGRKQVVRVLQLAVNDREGSWQSDPRGGAVRFLLDHRLTPGRPGHGIEAAEGGAAIGSAVSALTGVPEPMRARARLVAGDIFGAETLYNRSDSSGSFEWTPFLLDLARFRAAQNMIDAARGALESLAPAARNECDALIVRRQIARLSRSPVGGDVAEPAADWPPTNLAWSAGNRLAICVDPEAAPQFQLVTTVETDAPALIVYGWNEGRRGAVLLPAGRVVLRVPLTGLWGRSSFYVRSLTGGAVRPVGSRVDPL